MKKIFNIMLMVALLLLAGCGYRYYLGMPGPSIWNYPDIHADIAMDDSSCLECHGHADNEMGAPLTSHPHFTGCLKCHNSPS